MTEPKLETESLTRIIDGEAIVDSVSLRVQQSEVVAIIGSSGAGKSSFLRLLNRLDEPTEGTVYLDGTDYRELDPETVRRRIGLIPQEPALSRGLVAENVALAARLRGEPIDDERVRALLGRMGLAGYEERNVEDLSGGERQRVSIARTLYVDPEMLLLDEPTSHLDTASEAQIEELLTELIRDDDLTCVLVTQHHAGKTTRRPNRRVRGWTYHRRGHAIGGSQMTETAFETFLDHATDPVVFTGFIQIVTAVVLAALVLGVVYVRDLGFEREVLTTSGRGLVQVIAAGAVIGVLLTAHLVWATVVLASMIVVAGWISHERGDVIPGVFRASVISIGFGAGLVIVMMTFAGAIETTMRDLIVIGSMIIANAMKTNSLVLDRFTGELAANRSEIEAMLSVGGTPEQAIREYVSTSVYASIIPILDSIKSLGIVQIPGLMAGMIIAGANPIYAAQYQFVIMLMIFAAGGLTVVVNTMLISRRVFTEAKQLDDTIIDTIDA